MNKNIQKSHYATTPEGFAIDQYVLTNDNGMSMAVITFGGIVTKLTAPDRNGNFEDIVLGYNNPQDYFKPSSEYFGAIIGRVANRIANGQFTIDDAKYQLAINNSPNTLHGGTEGFDRKIWSAQMDESAANPTLVLTYVSTDMEQGFPGNLRVVVKYVLTNDNAFEISYHAETDQKTVVNLTHHSYFNLSGNFNSSILDHELMLQANTMLPINESLIPTGDIISVQGTPFDFTIAKTIGSDINAVNEQLEIAKGYDHSWIFQNGSDFKQVAAVYHPLSGREMTVATNQPAVQLYSGNFLDGTKSSKSGGTYQRHCGFCLETQQYPDAPNHLTFPSILLEPGAIYETRTIYQFSSR